MADDERPPFGHPNFYAPIWQMLRDAAKDPDCHAYTDELLFAADEIERLREREQDLRMHAEQDACEIERLRAAGDALYELVSVRLIIPTDQHDDAVEQIRKWKEARREE